MQRLQGIAVSPGVAIGEALVIDTEGFRIPQRFVARDTVECELERLDLAFKAAAGEISSNRDAIDRELGSQYASIFSAHLAMLEDPKLRSEIEQMIREKHFSPEYAVSRVMRRYAKVFQEVQSSYLAQRANDIIDIEKRLLRNLLGVEREELNKITEPVIVLAHNLTPSETANLNRKLVLRFVTEIGGAGSHTAIVAEALEIPAVVGTGPFMTDVSGGDLIIIDGNNGLVILQPDEETIARYKYEKEQERSLALRLGELRDVPAETQCGTRINLFGNIEFPYEVHHCTERGSDGVGLYRTEFLYLTSQQDPSEEDHYNAYAEVMNAMQGKSVTIRTLDLGADKLRRQPTSEEDRNPCLGLRSIRLSLRDLPLFRTQLRAILRASALGKVQVMFPLITTLMEFRQARMVLADVMEDLEERGIPFNRDVAVGMMVEVPAAVTMIDHFVEEVDFISIGTNDLIQYALAVDRGNKEVSSLYNSSDPAILRMIDQTVTAARKANTPVNLCGKMSSNVVYTQLLLGLGLTNLSVVPSAIPEVKKVCRAVKIDDCREIAQKAMTMENARNIRNFLKEELKKVAPEFID